MRTYPHLAKFDEYTIAIKTTIIDAYHQSTPQCLHIAVKLVEGSGDMFAGGACLLLFWFAVSPPRAGL